jgi:hypothetical protein
MLRRLALIPVLTAAAFAGACITSTTTVKVKANGSGTVEQVMLMNTAMIEQMGQMISSQMGGTSKTTSKSSNPFEDALSEDKMKAEIAKMKGVRLVSRTPIKQDGLDGVKVVLAFDDVNQLVLDENVGGKSKDPMRVSMVKNAAGNSVLTIEFPDKPGGAAGAKGSTGQKTKQAPKAEDLAMAQMFFKGFRIQMAVVVDGTLVRTSSPYVQGNTVTLLDLDMEKLFANPAALSNLDELPFGPGMSVTEARAALAKSGVEGIKINDPRVTIEFR